MTSTTATINKIGERTQLAMRLKGQATKALSALAIPLVGIAAFLMFWSLTAQSIDTSLGKFPGPTAVLEQFGSLYDEHNVEREKESAFYERQEQRNAKRLEQDPTYEPKIRGYTGKETFADQIATSLITVMSGFILAAIVAIPLGIAIGLSKTLNAAFNPVIQIFKPVSPLAWLPLAEQFFEHASMQANAELY